MSAAFATTVAVVVPVLLLAVGVEAREFEKRTRGKRGSVMQESLNTFLDLLRQVPDFDSQLSESENVELGKLVMEDMLQKASGSDAKFLTAVQKVIEGKPMQPELEAYVDFKLLYQMCVRLAAALLGAAWAGAVISLICVEGESLYWLGEKSPAAGAGLAQFSLVSIVACSILLFASPILRLLMEGAPVPYSQIWISPRSIRLLGKELKRVRRPNSRMRLNSIQPAVTVEKTEHSEAG